MTGNGDSFFVVDRMKNRYNLNPLLVTYNSHFNTKVGVRNLARLVAKLDCDHLSYTVGPETVKRLTKLAMHKLGDMYWHVLAGSQTFPVQVATKLKIPLIVWGVHGWLDQVGMFSHLDAVEMTKKVRREHGLRGVDAEDLIGADLHLTTKDLQAFTYPSDVQLETSRVRGLYLGNFIRWDAQAQTEEMIQKYGYETTPQERTFNTYESIHCWNDAGVHDYIKYLKYGYGKATDHASRDIRLKRLNREEGAELVRRYDHHKPKGLYRFLEWVNMTEQEWDAVIQVHLKGTFAPSRHAAAYWREKSKETGEPVGGRIVNTTSTSGIYGNMGQTNYGAAKAGIAAFTIIAARELRRIGVTVNAISPSAYTRMTEGLRELSEEEIADRHPKWVAPAVVYLCSEEAEDLTGRIIQAGGGMVAVCEGWRRGAEMEQMADPSELGVHLREMCQKVRKNSDMDGMELD